MLETFLLLKWSMTARRWRHSTWLPGWLKEACWGPSWGSGPASSCPCRLWVREGGLSLWWLQVWGLMICAIVRTVLCGLGWRTCGLRCASHRVRLGNSESGWIFDGDFGLVSKRKVTIDWKMLLEWKSEAKQLQANQQIHKFQCKHN